MINVVVLEGRLARDPEVRQGPNGNYCTFSLAVGRNFKNSQGEFDTDFIFCTAFRQTSDFIVKYHHKGDLIGIEGSISSLTQTMQDGTKRTNFSVVVNQSHFLATKKTGESNYPQDNYQAPSTQKADEPKKVVDIISDDDLPF